MKELDDEQKEAVMELIFDIEQLEYQKQYPKYAVLLGMTQARIDEARQKLGLGDE
jgi:hypothetical protein